MRMNIRTLVFTTVLTILTIGAGHAQSADGLYLTGTVAFPMQPDDLIGSAAIGGQIGYRFPGSFLILGEYLYAGTDYYYYDTGGTRWTKATGWPEVPSGSASRSDWIFYRTRHALGAAAGASGRVLRLGFFGTAGIMLSFINISDAEDYYPEFADEARKSSIDNGDVLVTTTLRAGLVYPAEGLLAGQLAYVIQLETHDDFGETQYVRRNSLLFIGLTLQTGGVR